MEALQITPLEQALLIATGLLLLVQIAYYLCLYSRIARHGKASAKSAKTAEAHGDGPAGQGGEGQPTLPPVSIVICASNQAANLRENLPLILEQDYPQFEVIVINDGPQDESEDYLTHLESQYTHLYHSFVPSSSRYISRKKLAITLGLKASKYDWIVLTEPDCQPGSALWLRRMAARFTPGIEVVLGYSGYRPGRGWACLRMAYDNLLRSMRYLGFALARSPYMGLGRNLAYRKQLFDAHKGFSAHLNLLRGDDDLLVNSVANGLNTSVEASPEAAMRIPADRRWKDWFDERIAYTSTACRLHGPQRWLAGGETTSRLLMYVAWVATLVVGIADGHWLVAGLGVLAFLLRWVLQMAVTNGAARTVGDAQRYYLSLPLLDLLQPLLSLAWKLGYAFRKKSEFLRK